MHHHSSLRCSADGEQISMADTALNNAEAKRKQLLSQRLALHSQIATLDEQIGKVDAFIRDWHLFAEIESELSTGHSSDSELLSVESPLDTPKRTRGNSRKEDVAEAAY